MYLESDYLTPAVMTRMNERKFKNRVLKYWPTKVVNDIVVMDILYLYIKGSGVQETTAHKKIYHLLNIDVKDLKAESWKGVENYYLHFEPTNEGYDDLTPSQLLGFIESEAPLTTKATEASTEFDRSDWYNITVSYEPVNVSEDSNALSDADIIARVLSNPELLEFETSLDVNMLTALCLMDTNQEVFEYELRVTHRQLTSVTSTWQTSKTNKGTFLKEANLNLRFRRKNADISSASAYLSKIIDYFTNTRTFNLNTTALVLKPPGSVSSQLFQVYDQIVPISDSNLILSSSGMFGTTSRGTAYYKKEGLRDLPSKMFKGIVGTLKTGYTEEKVDSWKKLVAAVVVIAIMVVAVVLSVPSGGSSLGAGLKASFATLGAFGLFAGKMALVLSIGMLAMTGISTYFAKNGDPAYAAHIGKSTQILGTVATVMGVVSLVAGISAAISKMGELAMANARAAAVNALGEGASQAAIDAAVQSAEVTLKDVLIGSTQYLAQSVQTSTAELLNKVLSWVSQGFNLYAKHINPPDKGVAELQRELQEQEQLMEDTTGPGMKDKVDYLFSSPFRNIYDFNEYMQQIPYEMTQGTIDKATTKYYE